MTAPMPVHAEDCPPPASGEARKNPDLGLLTPRAVRRLSLRHLKPSGASHR